MEEGWSEVDLPTDPKTFVQIGGQFSSADFPTAARAAKGFSQGQQQPFAPVGFVTNTVVLTESEAKAVESMNRLRSAGATKEWIQDFDEYVSTYKLAALSMNPLGDERLAFRLSVTDRSKASGQDFPYTRDTVYIRIGAVISHVGVQLADTGAYARKSEAKMRQLVSGEFN